MTVSFGLYTYANVPLICTHSPCIALRAPRKKCMHVYMCDTILMATCDTILMATCDTILMATCDTILMATCDTILMATCDTILMAACDTILMATCDTILMATCDTILMCARDTYTGVALMHALSLNDVTLRIYTWEDSPVEPFQPLACR